MAQNPTELHVGLDAQFTQNACSTHSVNWNEPGRSIFLRVRLAKTQISLRICAVWSESSQATLWVTKDPKPLQEASEDSGQTMQMRRLICVFAGCTTIL